MNLIPLLVVAVGVLPVLGLALWVWLAMSDTTEELSSFVGFDGMHFED